MRRSSVVAGPSLLSPRQPPAPVPLKGVQAGAPPPSARAGMPALP
jgi:hypothetical protein